MRSYLLILFLIMCLSTSVILTLSQTEIDKEYIEYVFEDNPCNLPCWYGLHAGESTVLEALHVVLNKFQINSFDLTTISFFRENDSLSEIYFEAGTVRSMIISPSRFSRITINNVINKVGKPSYIKVNRFPGQVYMILFYTDLNMVFDFVSLSEDCHVQSFLEDFYLRNTIFNSLDDFYPPWTIFPSDIILNDAKWQVWRSGEVDATCNDEIAYIAATHYASDAYDLTQTPRAATREANAIQLTEYAATQTAIAPTLTATATPGAGE